MEIRARQRWEAIGAPDDWLRTVEPDGTDAWLVAMPGGQKRKVPTAELTDSYRFVRDRITVQVRRRRREQAQALPILNYLEPSDAAAVTEFLIEMIGLEQAVNRLLIAHFAHPNTVDVFEAAFLGRMTLGPRIDLLVHPLANYPNRDESRNGRAGRGRRGTRASGTRCCRSWSRRCGRSPSRRRTGTRPQGGHGTPQPVGPLR